MAESLPPFLLKSIDQMTALAMTRLVQIVIMVWFFRHTGTRDLYSKNFRLGIRTGLIWSSLTGAAALTAGLLLNSFHVQPQELIQTTFPSQNQGIFLITGILLAPVAEELFFRGIAYSFLRTWNKPAAMILTSLIFSFFHGLSLTPAAVIPFTGGIVFCLAYDQSESILTPVIIHSLGNFALFIISACFI